MAHLGFADSSGHDQQIWRLLYEMIDSSIEINTITNTVMAEIQFSEGIREESVPNVRLTRSKDGSTGKAIFYFEEPSFLTSENSGQITGMYMIDEEGQIVTREVKCKFINGKPESLEAIHLMRSPEEWDRFMRFMERYAEENGLEFTKKS